MMDGTDLATAEAKMEKSPGLITHHRDSSASDAPLIDTIKARLRAEGDLPGAPLDMQLSLVDQMSAFELGRFMLANRGLNAYWIHRIVTYRPGTLRRDTGSELEYRVFEHLPLILATRERFAIFRTTLQSRVRPGATLASIPCGWMDDLLLLDYPHDADVRLLGVDLDPEALAGARALAQQRGLARQLTLHLADAWDVDLPAAADTVTSNGLNVYEADEARVDDLYRRFLDLLKPGGLLVTSFLTPPPSLSDASPWDMRALDPEMLALQNVLLSRVIATNWRHFHTHAQIRAQLERVGFVEIRFIDDRARTYPTVLAYKPS
jgi:SAM-dependent methyltransferase